MNSHFCYYETQLDGIEAKVYYAMQDGLTHHAAEIRVPRLSYPRLQEIYTMVKYDSPELFYAEAPSFRSTPAADHVTVCPQYLFSRSEAETQGIAAEKRLSRILAPVVGQGEVEKVAYIRDWLLNHVTYEKLKRNYSHEIYGVLFHGIGVCEGIAKTAKCMFDYLDMPSLVVLGRENSDGVRHAWNIAQCYGKSRHYDFTYMLSMSRGLKRYPYDGVTDEIIYRDHQLPVFSVPICR